MILYLLKTGFAKPIASWLATATDFSVERTIETACQTKRLISMDWGREIVFDGVKCFLLFVGTLFTATASWIWCKLLASLVKCQTTGRSSMREQRFHWCFMRERPFLMLMLGIHLGGTGRSPNGARGRKVLRLGAEQNFEFGGTLWMLLALLGI